MYPLWLKPYEYIIDNNGRFLHKDKKICQVEMYKNNNDMTPFFFNFGTFIIDLTQNKHYSNFG